MTTDDSRRYDLPTVGVVVAVGNTVVQFDPQAGSPPVRDAMTSMQTEAVRGLLEGALRELREAGQ